MSVAKLLGDQAILLAVRNNSMDANTAFTRLKARPDAFTKAKEVIEEGIKDTDRHLDWLKNN